MNSRTFLIKLILGYKIFRSVTDSILLSVFGASSGCKHLPTCSDYTIEAIREHGTIRGLLKGGYRILTCW